MEMVKVIGKFLSNKDNPSSDHANKQGDYESVGEFLGINAEFWGSFANQNHAKQKCNDEHHAVAVDWKAKNPKKNGTHSD